MSAFTNIYPTHLTKNEGYHSQYDSGLIGLNRFLSDKSSNLLSYLRSKLELAGDFIIISDCYASYPVKSGGYMLVKAKKGHNPINCVGKAWGIPERAIYTVMKSYQNSFCDHYFSRIPLR